MFLMHPTAVEDLYEGEKHAGGVEFSVHRRLRFYSSSSVGVEGETDRREDDKQRKRWC